MSRPAGFTLIELMIVVVLLAILMMIAAPSLRDITLNARMTAQTNDFMTDLAVARAEAVKRGGRTAMCASTNADACAQVPTGAGCQCTNAPPNQWNVGWIIFSDGSTLGTFDGTDTIVKVVRRIDGATEPQPNTITSANTSPAGIGPWVGFLPSGVINPGGTGFLGLNTTFDLCDSRTTANVASPDLALNKGRRITITGTGRASVARCTCGATNTCPP